jgi:LysR family glycine cleavage system transcriptional activator
VFEAVARRLSFTRAAEELGMTQAAVSYQIRILEERLGVPLFARHKGRVWLTEAGRRAAPAVSAGFEAIADAFAAMVADDGGVLTVSTTATFASNWLAPRLGSFQLARPELAVRLNTDNSIVDFARAEIDVGIRSTSGAADWPGLRKHFLFRLHSTPLCSPDFRDRHPVETPADLLSVPRLSPDDIWWADWFRAAGVAVPVETVPTGIRFDTQAMEGNAALAGAGASVLTPMFWRGELAAGRLVQLFALTSFEGPGYWLVYPEYKRNQPKIAAFRDWLLGEVEAEKAREPAEIFVAP